MVNPYGAVWGRGRNIEGDNVKIMKIKSIKVLILFFLFIPCKIQNKSLFTFKIFYILLVLAIGLTQQVSFASKGFYESGLSFYNDILTNKFDWQLLQVSENREKY